MDRDLALSAAHSLTLESRSRLALTGVTEVERFDETAAVLGTSQGALIVRGSGLHVEMLDLESGQIRLSGSVDSLSYEERGHAQGSFLQRLFG